jgi:hypothetical protein
MSTCRLCDDWRTNATTGPLVKYSVRHYAHADCALTRWGAGFFDRLALWPLMNFPAHAAARHGLLGELEARIGAALAAERARRLAAFKRALAHAR